MKQQVYFNVEETAKHANQSEARPGEYQAAVGNSGPVLGWVFLSGGKLSSITLCKAYQYMCVVREE